MTYYLAKYNDELIIIGERRLAKLDEPKANKSASKREQSTDAGVSAESNLFELRRERAD